MLDNESRVKADDSRREEIFDEWLKTNTVSGLSFAQFYHEFLPLIRHTFPERVSKEEEGHIIDTLYGRFAVLYNEAAKADS